MSDYAKLAEDIREDAWRAGDMRDKTADAIEALIRERDEARAENERLLEGFAAAIRAAELAIFVIRKQGIMPNDSWKAGFEKDMATAKAALGRKPE
jgi:hypothetical protein